MIKKKHLLLFLFISFICIYSWSFSTSAATNKGKNNILNLETTYTPESDDYTVDELIERGYYIRNNTIYNTDKYYKYLADLNYYIQTETISNKDTISSYVYSLRNYSYSTNDITDQLNKIISELKVSKNDSNKYDKRIFLYLNEYNDIDSFIQDGISIINIKIWDDTYYDYLNNLNQFVSNSDYIDKDYILNYIYSLKNYSYSDNDKIDILNKIIGSLKSITYLAIVIDDSPAILPIDIKFSDVTIDNYVDTLITDGKNIRDKLVNYNIDENYYEWLMNCYYIVLQKVPANGSTITTYIDELNTTYDSSTMAKLLSELQILKDTYNINSVQKFNTKVTKSSVISSIYSYMSMCSELNEYDYTFITKAKKYYADNFSHISYNYDTYNTKLYNDGYNKDYCYRLEGYLKSFNKLANYTDNLQNEYKDLVIDNTTTSPNTIDDLIKKGYTLSSSDPYYKNSGGTIDNNGRTNLITYKSAVEYYADTLYCSYRLGFANDDIIPKYGQGGGLQDSIYPYHLCNNWIYDEAFMHFLLYNRDYRNTNRNTNTYQKLEYDENTIKALDYLIDKGNEYLQTENLDDIENWVNSILILTDWKISYIIFDSNQSFNTKEEIKKFYGNLLLHPSIGRLTLQISNLSNDNSINNQYQINERIAFIIGVLQSWRNQYRPTNNRVKPFFINTTPIVALNYQKYDLDGIYYLTQSYITTRWTTINNNKIYLYGQPMSYNSLDTTYNLFRVQPYKSNNTKNPNWYVFYLNNTSDHLITYIDNKLQIKDFDLVGTLTYKTGLQTIDGKKYIFDSNGILLEGWINYNGNKYYSKSQTNSGYSSLVTGEQEIDGKKYKFDVNGKLISEVKPETPVKPIKSGWTKTSKGYTYLFSNGKYAKSEYVNGYWLNSKGYWTYKYKATWKHNSNGWWYSDSTGWYAKNQWLKIDQKWYYFNKFGYMTTGWQKINKKWYYFNKSGIMQTGWLKLSNKWYYFDTTNGYMLSNTSKKIGNKTYKFNKNGICTNP